MVSTAGYEAARSRVLEVCREVADDRTLRVEVVGAVRRVVGFDAYAWLLTDPETSVGSSPLADVPFLADLPRAIGLKYLTPINRWNQLVEPVSLLSDATGGELSRSLMWSELLCHHGITDGASSVFRDRFGCWGFLDLWRADARRRSFSAADAGFLARINGPVTDALRRSQAQTFADQRGTVSVPAEPVVLLLSPALAVRAQTPSVQRYLRVLVPPGHEGGSAVPAGAYNVTAQLLAVEAGVDDNPPLARVHLAGGAWLAMKAARLEGARPGDPADIAVTIEPAAAGERISLFSRASGLSARESELLAHLATGADTREVARAMHVSQNTIQDHLKSVFTKTGTRTRRMVLSRALGHR